MQYNQDWHQHQTEYDLPQSSDSDSDSTSLSLSACAASQLAYNMVYQLLTNHLHCNTPSAAADESQDLHPVVNFAQLNRFFQHDFPLQYPQPSKFGFPFQLNPDIWRRILCGISNHQHLPRQIPRLDPQSHQSGSIQLNISYDIDSFIAKATDLGIAKVGLNFQICPNQLHNISKDIHLFIPIAIRSESGTFQSQQVPLHKIPHFRLGTIHSALFLPLYVFFPTLYNPTSTSTNYLTNQHIKQWMDDGFLPSLYRHYSPDILQHIPSAYDIAYMSIYARSKEFGQQESNPATSLPRRQELHYFLQGLKLDKIWNDMVIFSEQPGNDHFQKMFLLLDAKDLKLITKADSIDQAWHCFEKYLNSDLQLEKLDRDFCFLDLAQESIDRQPEQILLWQTCCLKTGLERIRSKCSGIRAGIYNWALTSIAANRTIQFSPHSEIYKAGFVYSQSYSPLKCLFEVAGHYPFQNSSLDFLSLSPEVIKSWKASGPEGSGLRFDLTRIEQAYIHGRDRVLAALDSAIRCKRSFGIRQEHRISIDLLSSIQLRARSFESTGQIAQACISVESNEILQFLRFNFLHFGLALEYTTLQLRNPQSHHSDSHGQMVRMFLQLQRNSISSTILEAAGDLWRDYPTSTSRVQCRGLGLKVPLGLFNFAWIPQDSLDLITWTMGTRFQQSTAFTFIQLPAHLHAKTPVLLQKRSALAILNDFRQVLSKINNPQSKHTYRILSYLGTMAIQHFRTDIWTALNNFCSCLWNNDVKLDAALKGRIGLQSTEIINFNPSRYSRIRYSNKHQFTLQDRWEILFHWDDRWEEQNLRQAWKNWPFRIFFQTCYTMISEVCNSDTARLWESQLVQRPFVRSNLVLPSPSKQNILQRNTSKGNQPRIYWVPLKHCSWTKESTTRLLPKAYSQEDKWDNWEIDYELPIMNLAYQVEPLYQERQSPIDFLTPTVSKIS